MQPKNLLVQLCRILVGGLFILSGYLKMVDPRGFGYKLEEYFGPTVFDMEFLARFALLFAVILVVFEVLLGIFLLLGLWRKFTFYSILVLIVFFTFLTFYSAFYNKVTDCGCFGDAIKLTPWESFYKDVVLFVLIVVIGLGLNQIKPLFSAKVNAIVLAFLTAIMVFILNLGINHLPLQDFRPFAVGVNIPQGMQLPADAIPDSVQRIWRYKVNGELKEFSDEQAPWNIPNAEYVDREDIVIVKGTEPKIKADFLFSCQGENKTETYLADPKLALIISPIPSKLCTKGWSDMVAFGKELEKKGFTVVALASDELPNHDFDFCTMDATMLKTIIRANPGVVFLRNGTIVGKYHHHDIPRIANVEKLFP